MLDRKKLIDAAAVEAADFLPSYPDGGRAARACAERVLAGAGFFDLLDREKLIKAAEARYQGSSIEVLRERERRGIAAGVDAVLAAVGRGDCV